MAPTLGFTNQVAKAQEAKSLRQFKEQVKADERVKKFEIKQQAILKKQELKLKKFQMAEMSKARKTNNIKQFKDYNKKILSSKIIPRSAPDQFASRSLPQRNESWNPFAHRDPIEVYGDDGLTLFDGEKKSDDDTGSLFGISKRRFR